MTVMTAILQEIQDSPDFKSYVEALNQTLRREEKRRQRFRESLDDDVRAEFINGRVVTQVAAIDQHITAVQNISSLASVFVKLKKLGAVRSEQALVAFPRNDYGPDVCFWKKAKSAHFKRNQLIYPLPDFICEVLSPSTTRIDRFIKFRDYQENGVAEYWLVDPELGSIQQNVLSGKRYKLIGEFTSGVIRAHAIRGFRMPVRAAFDDDEYLVAMKGLMSR